MKHVKIHVAIVLLVLSLFLIISVSEAEEGYVECILNDYKLSVLIPDSFVVVYEDMPESKLSSLGLQKTDLDNILNSFNGQLYAEKLSNRLSSGIEYYDMIAISLSDEIYDYNLFEELSEEELLNLMERSSQNVENKNDAYAEINLTLSIYHTPEYTFLSTWGVDPSIGLTQSQYMTIYNRRLLTVQFWFYSQATDSEIEMMHTICDSIHEVKQSSYGSFFDITSFGNNKTNSTQNLKYSDTNNGLVLTLPIGWKQDSFSNPKQFLTAKFTDNKGNMIMYGCLDYWLYLSNFEKKAYYSNKRANFDYTALTVGEVAEIYEVPKEDVTLILRGGHWCYYYKVSGMDVYLIIENGRLYIFDFFMDSSLDSVIDELFANAEFSE